MSDHETTLRGLAGGIYIDASLPILHLAPAENAACLAGADAHVLLRELVTLVRGECPSVLNEDSGGDGALSYKIDQLLAGAGADAPRRGTCANCDHRIDWPDAIGCDNARGLNRDEVSPGDFCSQWAPRRDAPTEPTR